MAHSIETFRKRKHARGAHPIPQRSLEIVERGRDDVEFMPFHRFLESNAVEHLNMVRSDDGAFDPLQILPTHHGGLEQGSVHVAHEGFDDEVVTEKPAGFFTQALRVIMVVSRHWDHDGIIDRIDVLIENPLFFEGEIFGADFRAGHRFFSHI